VKAPPAKPSETAISSIPSSNNRFTISEATALEFPGTPKKEARFSPKLLKEPLPLPCKKTTPKASATKRSALPSPSKLANVPDIGLEPATEVRAV